MLNVALAQYAVESTREKTYLLIEQCLEEYDKSYSAPIDLLLLPELFSTPYFCREQNEEYFSLAQDFQGSDIEFLKKIAKQYQCIVSTTFYEKIDIGLAANTSVHIDANENIIARYRKSHLPQDPCFEEKYYFQPGRSLPEITPLGPNNSFKLATPICWDQWFPELARVLALNKANILSYPTAIAWLKGEEDDFSSQLQSWLTMTKSHAIANGCFIACPNRIGVEGDLQFWGNSHLTGPDHRTLISFDEREQGVKSAILDLDVCKKARLTWPFLRDRRPDLYQDLV